MPPRGVKDPKMKRMYEHIKETEMKEQGKSEEEAERIAAATVNEYREKHGKTKEKED